MGLCALYIMARVCGCARARVHKLIEKMLLGTYTCINIYKVNIHVDAKNTKKLA